MDIPFSTFLTKYLGNTVDQPLEKSLNFPILVGLRKILHYKQCLLVILNIVCVETGTAIAKLHETAFRKKLRFMRIKEAFQLIFRS